MTNKPQDNWEKEFDKEFPEMSFTYNNDGELFSIGDWIRKKEIKSFIRSLLSSQQERIRGEIEGIDESKYLVKPYDGNPIEQVKKDILMELGTYE